MGRITHIRAGVIRTGVIHITIIIGMTILATTIIIARTLIIDLILLTTIAVTMAAVTEDIGATTNSAGEAESREAGWGADKIRILHVRMRYINA